MLNITIAVPGCAAVIWRAASMPLRLGIAISRRITSGVDRLAISTVSRPSAASATTSKPGSRSSRSRRPVRRTVWSSASRIRILRFIFRLGEVHRVRVRQRQTNEYQRAAARLGRNAELAAEAGYTFLHPEHAESFFTGRVEAPPVILHGNVERRSCARHRDPHIDRARMTRAISQSLLHDAVNARLVCLRQFLQRLIDADRYAHAGLAGHLAPLPLQGRQQSKIVEHRRPQRERDVTDDVHAVGGEAAK